MSEPVGPVPARAENDGASLLQIPLLILVVAFGVLCVFQTVQLVSDREMLANLKLAQEPAVQEGSRIRQQLDSIFSKTNALANEGNANAKLAIEELRKQGITATQRQ
jgi:uncharacterized protein YoxC